MADPERTQRKLPDPAADPVAVHFVGTLATKEGSGGTIAAVAKGDCCIMLELIRMKINDPAVVIDSSNPGRFRGRKALTTDMKTVLDNPSRVHIPKWGASHVRGALRDDKQRGNKRHLIQLIGLLNGYTEPTEQLTRVYHLCIRRHHQFWEGFSLQVPVQEDDPAQKRLLQLLSLSTVGRVQQGLVFSALRRRFGAENHDEEDVRRRRTKFTLGHAPARRRSGLGGG